MFGASEGQSVIYISAAFRVSAVRASEKLRGNSMPGPLSPAPLTATKPRRKAPAGSIDCHFHIFGPADKYPIDPTSLYTPSPEANIKTYQAMADTLGIQRMVIVNPTPYGTDTRVTIESIGVFGKDRAKAV